MEKPILNLPEDEFQVTLDNMVDTFYRLRPDGTILLFSRSVEELLGWTADELIGQNITRLFVGEDDRTALFKELDRGDGRISGFETRLCRKNGGPTCVSLTASYRQELHSRWRCIEGIIRDVSQQRQLLESHERLVDILHATPDFVGTADFNQKLLYLNHGARQLLGCGDETEISDLYLSSIHPLWAYEKLVEESLPEAIWHGTWSGESAVWNSKGMEIPVWQTLVIHRTPEQEIAYISFIMKDMTEHREKEKQLAHDQKMQALGRLTSGIAHDIGNLVTVLKGNLNLLQESSISTCEDPEAGDLLQDAITATEDATTLTNQLRQFARIGMIEPRLIDLNAAIEAALGLLRNTLGKRIQLHADLAPDLPPIQSDLTQLRSALLNLTVNAHDAMPQGGTLTIRTETICIGKEANQSYQHLKPGEYICLCVTDTGTGMDDELLDRVCDPFFTTKTYGKGTGLGLSLIYGFMQQSGGLLRIQSRLGQGTRVELLFPAVPAAANDFPHQLQRQ